MPQYRFQAVDADGLTREGVLEAPSPGHLAQRLAGEGLKVKAVGPVGTEPAAPAPQAVSPSQVAPANAAPPRVGAPIQPRSRPIEQSQPQVVNQIGNVPRPALPIQRTGRVPNHSLSFFFTQLGTMWRSGVPPTTALQTLADQERRPALRQALQTIVQTTAERGSLAEAMAAFPDVFPEGAVGAIAAGEAGGYVPLAAAMLGEQFMAAHKLGWAARVTRWSAFYIGFVGLPFVMAGTSGMMKMVDQAVNGASGSSPGQLLGLFVRTSAVTFFTSWPLLVLLVGSVLYFGGAWWMRKTEQRQLRHRLGLKIPVFGHFARQENLSAFCDHLERLSAAGLSPRLSWELASRAVPNGEFSEMLQGGLVGTPHETPFSDMAVRSGIVPPDQASLIRTGEMTGTLPDAFRHMSMMAKDKARNWRFGQLYTLWIVAFLICSLGGLIGAATFWAGLYNQEITSALKE